jgi:putative oxidoreductase
MGSSWLILLGRVLMAFIFIHGGINKATAPAATMAYFTKLSLPMPGVAYAIALLVEIGAGVAFLIGWKTRWSALVLAFWCIATAFAARYHPDDANQMIHFMKNVCMCGGFLQVVAFGAGRFSVDRK